MISRTARTLRTTSRGLAAAGIAVLLVNVGIQMIDILCRWLLNAPQAWVADIYELTLPVAIAACFPLTLSERGMIAIEFLGRALGPKIDRVLTGIGASLLFALFALMAWQIFGEAREMAQLGRSTWMLGLPLAPTWFAVSVVIGFGALVQVPMVGRCFTEGSRLDAVQDKV